MQSRLSPWRRRQRSSTILAAVAFLSVSIPVCRADAITDWDAKASAVAAPAALGERELAIVDIAMFDAVNSITPKYKAFLGKESGFNDASAEAAAASAAANALVYLHPQASADIKAALEDYIKSLPLSHADIAKGMRLGELVAKRVFDSRSGDGSSGVDSYRPRTQPGMYVPTTTMVAATWPTLRPFVLEHPDQFRPGPPVALTSQEWASDYNEVKTYGARNSSLRTPEQTEAAKFWLMTGPQAYHPIVRQIILARHLKLVDSARFMAALAIAMTDAYIAVFDAKYHYEFWRPVTAIRNGDIDGNPDTEMDPSWQPLDATPMHPEYPCAHCLLSGAAAAVIQSYGGLQDVQEISLTSPTAPGITHHWSSLDAFTAEVANARIWAGFHYRSSGRVGTAMGREVGRYVAANFAPVQK